MMYRSTSLHFRKGLSTNLRSPSHGPSQEAIDFVVVFERVALRASMALDGEVVGATGTKAFFVSASDADADADGRREVQFI